MERQLRILVLGASGYVGGRLVPRLLDAGHTVRCLARDPAKLQGTGWIGRAEVVRGDLLDEDGVAEAFDDIDVVYHLVHSMGGGDDFVEQDRRIARTVAQASAAAGVERIVYLGGLTATDDAESEHMRSRAEVGEVLARGSVPVTVLRAAVIIGSGSASFEMLRHLVEVLPAMITPRWVESRVQPIAIRDVLRYLIGVLVIDDAEDHVFDIGGPDILTYREMMRTFAEVAGLPRRIIVGVPFLTPRLSSHWVGLVTPVPASIARPLVDSVTVDAVAEHGTAPIERLVPGERIGYRRALRLALARVRDHDVETSWREADLASRGPAEPDPSDPEWSGGTLYADERTATCTAPPEMLFRSVCGVGGERGWLTHDWAWQLRGIADRAVGGIGLRRGRRDPDTVRVGDAIDFWRVVEARPPTAERPGLLRLFAEMRLPGKAWLEFHVAVGGSPHATAAHAEVARRAVSNGAVALTTQAGAGRGRADHDEGGSVLWQRALFVPRGLFGRLYWLVLLPFHGAIFPNMADRLARRAEQLATSSDVPTEQPVVLDGPATAAAPDEPPQSRAG